MDSRRRYTRLLLILTLVLSLASCSKDDRDDLVGPGPDPGPTGPPDSAGFFVSAAIGHDDSAGTKAAPFKTIGKALAAAAGLRLDVFVARGVYQEGAALDVKSGVSLLGGYDETTWTRDRVKHVTEIRASAPSVAIECVHAESLTIDGFTIRGADQTTSGVSSVCIVVAGTSKEVVISNNVLIAGRGADGDDGQSVNLGSGAGNGGPGAPPGICPRLGGPGGTSTAGWAGGAGGAGGNFDGSAGAAALGSDATYGGGGAGGTALSPEGKNGKPGRAGTNGAHGQAGASLGTFRVAYVPSDGTDGMGGSPGRGGGGGGGAFGNGVSCGAGGGGGGGGGRGGAAGTKGRGGAGSFAIFVNGRCTVQILNNTITTGDGGDGGDSGLGSSGSSGSGGEGGELTLFASGGDGGAGGPGGNGGHGGPGGGGPSIAIVVAASSDETVRLGNTITLGAPGAGGTTDAAGQPNAPAGIAAEFYHYD